MTFDLVPRSLARRKVGVCTPTGRGMSHMRVLLSEASSLTAREYLSLLGPAAVGVDVATSNGLAIARFSRWCGHVVRVPRAADDPRGYLDAVAAAIQGGRYDALLPTHEQAWLFAAGRRFLPHDT